MEKDGEDRGQGVGAGQEEATEPSVGRAGARAEGGVVLGEEWRWSGERKVGVVVVVEEQVNGGWRWSMRGEGRKGQWQTAVWHGE